MIKLWPAVTKENPCPVCCKTTWCALGDFSVKCMREPSDHPSKDGGWYHPYSHRHASFNPPKRDIAPPLKNGGAMMVEWEDKFDHEKRHEFSKQLGVSVRALDNLWATYAPPHKAWAFPMRDANKEIIGIRLRNEKGDKWAVKGSRQGLFIPCEQSTSKILFIVEGPTDLCAALDLGLCAIGRPSCNSSSEMIREYIRLNQINRCVIVTDNDKPGIAGAVRLGKEIKRPYVVFIPPAGKDLRSFLQLGGNKSIVEFSIRNTVWEI
jgi:hypothetical protein